MGHHGLQSIEGLLGSLGPLECLQLEAVSDGHRHKTKVLDESVIERCQSNEAPMSWMVEGQGHEEMASIFCGSADTPSDDTMNPRKETLVVKK